MSENKTQMNIIVGSTSEHKLAAVRQACEMLDIEGVVTGVKTPFTHDAQPMGLDATYSGALARAMYARSEHDCDLAIGIESGILRLALSPITIELAFIVLVTPERRLIITTSEGIQFPEDCVEMAYELGFETTTVGSIIAEKLGGDATDPHSTITSGKVSRNTTLVDALMTALEQLEDENYS